MTTDRDISWIQTVRWGSTPQIDELVVVNECMYVPVTEPPAEMNMHWDDVKRWVAEGNTIGPPPSGKALTALELLEAEYAQSAFVRSQTEAKAKAEGKTTDMVLAEYAADVPPRDVKVQ